MDNRAVSQSFPYIRHKAKDYLWSCLVWILGVLVAVILFLIFVIAFQPKFIPNEIRQIPRKVHQTLDQLKKRGQPAIINSINPVAILMYHYIRNVDKDSDPLGFSLSVSPTVFENQIKYLTENFNVIDFDDFVAGKIPERAVILTFDDGYEDFYTTGAPILKKYGLPGVIFMITGRIGQDGYLSAKQLRELKRRFSVTVGSHSVSHPNFSNTSLANQTKEASQSKQTLEKIIGEKVKYFCFPSGEYSYETLRILKQEGYKLAVTTQDGLAYRRDNWMILSRVRVSGKMGLLGFKEKLNQLFKDFQPSAP